VREQAEAKERRRLEETAKVEGMSQIDQDKRWAFIAGHTPGGAPYGIPSLSLPIGLASSGDVVQSVEGKDRQQEARIDGGMGGE
jgi:cytolysin (calcineurin-like family phosphatase)